MTFSQGPSYYNCPAKCWKISVSPLLPELRASVPLILAKNMEPCPWHYKICWSFVQFLACSRLRDSRVRWIEKAQTQKWNGRKLGREGAAEPVIISLNDPFRYTSSWYTLWLVRFDRLYQHSQSGSLLSLREMACGVHAREIEESTITSALNECLRDFPNKGALRKEQKTCLVNLVHGKHVFIILPTGFGLA